MKKILAIESSCDETAAAVIAATDDRQQTTDKIRFDSLLRHNARLEVLANVVASQIDLHKKYGGVYPEVASRAHAEQILPVIDETLAKAGIGKDLKEIDAIAVTYGPGLVGSLVVGVAAAKTLAYCFSKPIIPVHHWEGHIYSNFIGEFPISNFQFPKKESAPREDIAGSRIESGMTEVEKRVKIPEFPSLILTVSGGHTNIILMKDHGDYEILGQTLDDAAGEAFDKVARLLGLSYPGGPSISAAAERIMNYELSIAGGKPGFLFPRPMTDRANFDFSFSGLKTAVLYKVREMGELDDKTRAELAYEFQEAVTDTLIIKTKQAMKKFAPKSVCLSGGVSANKVLREKFLAIADGMEIKPTIHIPPFQYTTDNAAMVGAAGMYHLLHNKVEKWYNVNVEPGATLKSKE